jgi:hypothetical protein
MAKFIDLFEHVLGVLLAGFNFRDIESQIWALASRHIPYILQRAFPECVGHIMLNSFVRL